MIRVIIERWVDPTLVEPLRQQLVEIRQQIVNKPGYLAAESFQDMDDPGHWIVMSKWSSRKNWQDWADSKQRQEQLALIEALLIKPEKIAVFEPR